jgi:hypothetical protein
MFGSTKWHTAVFNVPDTVQDLMSVRTTTLTFTFLDPVQCLIRLLTAGPLSANEENMAFVPRLNGRWYVFIMMWAVIQNVMLHVLHLGMTIMKMVTGLNEYTLHSLRDRLR